MANYINGTSGNDVLSGTQYIDDRIDGYGGDDLIENVSDGDIADGGAGNDILINRDGGILLGGDGDDILDLSYGYLAQGGTGNDTLFVRGGRAYGQAGNDILTGYGRLDGGAGDDFIRNDGGDIRDNGYQLFGGGGNDTIFADYGNDYIRVSDGRTFSDGSYGEDLLQAFGTGFHTMTGGADDDRFDFRASGAVLDLNFDDFDTLRVAKHGFHSVAEIAAYDAKHDDFTVTGDLTSRFTITTEGLTVEVTLDGPGTMTA